MKKFKDIYESKSNPVAQRRALARRMSKIAKSSAVKAKKARARLKMRNPAKLALLARKQTIQSFRDKYFPRYNEMSIPQKVKTDQLIMQKYGKKIDAISKRKLPLMKKAELERVKKARENEDA